jgi:hypothetical protein
MRRGIFLTVGVFQALLATGFILGADWATSLWPWDEGRLSHLFLGSILAAFAAGITVAVLRGTDRGLGPALITAAAVAGAVGVQATSLSAAGAAPSGGLAVAGIATAVGAVALLPGVNRAKGPPLDIVTRASCAVFALALIGAGGALVSGAPYTFPWSLGPQTARMFGLIFLGLSLAYGLTAWTGSRDSALIIMAGFLAYDLVLLPPFIGLFAILSPSRELSLTLYTGVLVYSALLALWVLGRAVVGRAPNDISRSA